MMLVLSDDPFIDKKALPDILNIDAKLYFKKFEKEFAKGRKAIKYSIANKRILDYLKNHSSTNK